MKKVDMQSLTRMLVNVTPSLMGYCSMFTLGVASSVPEYRKAWVFLAAVFVGMIANNARANAVRNIKNNAKGIQK